MTAEEWFDGKNAIPILVCKQVLVNIFDSNTFSMGVNFDFSLSVYIYIYIYIYSTKSIYYEISRVWNKHMEGFHIV